MTNYARKKRVIQRCMFNIKLPIFFKGRIKRLKKATRQKQRLLTSNLKERRKTVILKEKELVWWRKLTRLDKKYNSKLIKFVIEVIYLPRSFVFFIADELKSSLRVKIISQLLVVIIVVQSLSHVGLFEMPWTTE